MSLLFERLPLIADGGLAYPLAQRHTMTRLPVESLCLSRPEAVKGLYQEYAAAGATMLRTNSLAACRPLLARQGMEDQMEGLNVAAANLAKEVCGEERAVMGSVGPLRRGDDGWAETDLEKIYAEQMIYLSDAQIDVFFLEHFDWLDELELAVRVAGRVSDAPVMAGLKVGPDNLLACGSSLAEAAIRLAQAGAGALALSCQQGALGLEARLDSLLGAGLPVGLFLSPIGDEAAPLSPAAFAQILAPMAGRGASILGGCCGATPQHIQALNALAHPQ